jgi:aminopeptidase N
VAAGWPRVMSSKGNRPRAYLGHEISHLWTHGAGPAANFLNEGWATYAESLILEKEFGPEAVKAFWKYQADDYLRQFDGKASMLEDENNGGVAYPKGAWVFHMLEDALGSDAFQKAIADYSRRSLAQPSGWDVLAECAQRYASPDFDARAFLEPWLAGKRAPHLTAEIDAHKVTIRQDPPGFFLPVTVEASTAQGAERHRVWIKGPATAVSFSADPSDVRIDPSGSLLLRR